jgi:hypothetical protein
VASWRGSGPHAAPPNSYAPPRPAGAPRRTSTTTTTTKPTRFLTHQPAAITYTVPSPSSDDNQYAENDLCLTVMRSGSAQKATCHPQETEQFPARD